MVALIILLLFSLTVVRVLSIQFFHSKAARYAKAYTVQERPVEAVRGDILDCNGRLLVTSVPIYDIYFDFGAEGLTNRIFRSEVDALARALSNYFEDRTAGEYKRLLEKGYRQRHRYFPIKKGISYRDWQVVRTFPLFRHQTRNYIVGLIRVPRYRRLNVYGIADRVIGYVRNDVKVGIEGGYDAYLAGSHGTQRMKKTYGGVWVPVDGGYVVEPMMGATVQSTLDYRIQRIAEQALLRGMIRHRAEWGSVVVMETATGAVRALANLTRKPSDQYWDDRNYAIGEAVEPGSTIKLATLLVLMKDKDLRPSDSIDVDGGRFRIYDRTIRDGAQVPHGYISLREAFIYSSNVAFGRWAYELYGENPERFLQQLRALKLHEPLGAAVPGEARPFIPTPEDKRWSGTTLPWLAFGYGLKLTPLQILTLYNGVVNGGRMVKPRFVEAIIEPDGDRTEIEPQTRVAKMASRALIDTIKTLMEEVVRHGTARGIRRGKVPIGGKTGTVWLYKEGRYQRDRFRASFVGFFPAEAPKYTAIVVINDPQNGFHSGGSVAAPILREIAEKMYLQMIFEVPSRRSAPPHRPARWVDRKKLPMTAFETWARRWGLVYEEPESTAPEWIFTRAVSDDTVHLSPVRLLRRDVPNVKGLPVADAVYMVEGLGLKTEIRGTGMRVTAQSLPPGTPVRPRRKIVLWTE